MSGLINITGTAVNDDPTYRYKMPRLMAKTEGRGNGIKTVVMNMAEIAMALNRPPSLPTKFFGTELGAQSRWEPEAEKATVNGVHTAPDLQKLMNLFIDKFVLCPHCHLPETALVVKKGIIGHKCSACGAREPVDMSHKLCTFILKEAAAATAEVEAAKKAKKAKKEKSADGSEEKKKEKKEKKEKVKGEGAATAAAGSGADADGDGDGDSSSDEDATATAGKSAVAPAGMPALEADTSDADALRAAIEAAGVTADALAEDVRKRATNAGLRPTERAALLMTAVLGTPKAAALEKPAVLAALKKLVHESAATAAASQTSALAALQAAALGNAAILPLVSPVLVKLYDADVLEEDTIVAWYGRAPEAVKTKAEKFVTWLQTADEDEEED